jgi:hypothetical protein
MNLSILVPVVALVVVVALVLSPVVWTWISRSTRLDPFRSVQLAPIYIRKTDSHDNYSYTRMIPWTPATNYAMTNYLVHPLRDRGLVI